jgi:hypothetical protein
LGGGGDRLAGEEAGGHEVDGEREVGGDPAAVSLELWRVSLVEDGRHHGSEEQGRHDTRDTPDEQADDESRAGGGDECTAGQSACRRLVEPGGERRICGTRANSPGLTVVRAQPDM